MGKNETRVRPVVWPGLDERLRSQTWEDADGNPPKADRFDVCLPEIEPVTEVQGVTWGAEDWELLIPQELLTRCMEAERPLPLAGVSRPSDRRSVAMRVAAPGEASIGTGWREGGLGFVQPGCVEVAVPAEGGARARYGTPEGPVAARLRIYADASRFQRLNEVVDVPRLHAARVTMIGCGAVGSPMALQLACAGVGEFRLADLDVLLPANLSRHACDARDLLRSKVDAVGDMVQMRNPRARVEKLYGDICGDGYEWLERAVAASDLVIATTDSNRAQATAHAVAVAAGVPFLSSGVWEKAFGGEVFWVFPRGGQMAKRFGETPCYQCVFSGSRPASEEPVRKPEDAACVALDPSPDGQPGAGIDLLFTTQVALGVAMAILNPDSSRSVLIDHRPNLIYCHSGKANQWPTQLDGPFDVRHKPVRFDPHCPICGETDFLAEDVSGQDYVSADTTGD